MIACICIPQSSYPEGGVASMLDHCISQERQVINLTITKQTISSADTYSSTSALCQMYCLWGFTDFNGTFNFVNVQMCNDTLNFGFV